MIYPPKYVQQAIKRLLFHSKVVKNNTLIVDKWFKENDIDRNTNLLSLIESDKKEEKPTNGQLNIFDYLEKRNV